MKNKGYTLIELSIAMGIIALVFTLSAGTFKTLLKGANEEKGATETELNKITGLDLLRLDLQHTGYGMSSTEQSPPIQWDNSTKTLTLRSMINNTNQKTLGWVLFDITAGSQPTIITDRRKDTSVNDFVLLTQYREFITNLTGIPTTESLPGPDYAYYTSPPNCPSSKCRDYINQTVIGVPANRYIATGYPFDRTVSDGCTTTAGGQYCTSITYTLSTNASHLEKCAPGTQNFIRRIGTGTSENRVLECVADFVLSFDIDGNNDGDVLDTNEQGQTTLPGPPSGTPPQPVTEDMMNKVKNIDVYLLVQAGPKKQNYTFNGNIDSSFPQNSGLTFTPLTEDQEAYRWKVVKMSAKPMSW